ncbi:hypothetical protein IV203_015437 [Nitzschia inconspicua]|uniref:Uncharacterized protein n=1 Tax=Nitzschia inconspicua TaxID=303405 RepID=A0A9K3LC80_9STRA|nr:hypothetical protein IV203_015437 [Nitzschia inconspicua]
MVPQDMFAQASCGISHLDVNGDGENQYEPGAAATPKNSKPAGANGGHRDVKWPKISEAKATLIGPDNLARFTDGLGGSVFCVVEEPCGSVRETIKEWMQPGRNIPVEAVHVVVRKCFYIATRQDSSRNVVEMFVWGGRRHARGGTLSCILSSQQGCPVDFNKLHCQKEEEAHLVLPVETCPGAIAAFVRPWHKPMRLG